MKDVQRYGLNGIGNMFIFFFFKAVEQFNELMEKYSTFIMFFVLEYEKENAGISSGE